MKDWKKFETCEIGDLIRIKNILGVVIYGRHIEKCCVHNNKSILLLNFPSGDPWCNLANGILNDSIKHNNFKKLKTKIDGIFDWEKLC